MSNDDTLSAVLANIQDMVERMSALEERQDKLEKMYKFEEVKKLLQQVDDLTDAEIERRDIKLRDTIDPILDELKESAKRTQVILQAQVIRSSTFTEVLRFIRVEAPGHLNQSMVTMLSMHDKSDKWWNSRGYLRVWQWAALLVPQYRHKWEQRYGKALDEEFVEDRKIGEEEYKKAKEKKANKKADIVEQDEMDLTETEE